MAGHVTLPCDSNASLVPLIQRCSAGQLSGNRVAGAQPATSLTDVLSTAAAACTVLQLLLYIMALRAAQSNPAQDPTSCGSQ